MKNPVCVYVCEFVLEGTAFGLFTSPLINQSLLELYCFEREAAGKVNVEYL
jgi:hypothetical protein